MGNAVSHLDSVSTTVSPGSCPLRLTNPTCASILRPPRAHLCQWWISPVVLCGSHPLPLCPGTFLSSVAQVLHQMEKVSMPRLTPNQRAESKQIGAQIPMTNHTVPRPPVVQGDQVQAAHNAHMLTFSHCSLASLWSDFCIPYSSFASPKSCVWPKLDADLLQVTCFTRGPSTHWTR